MSLDILNQDGRWTGLSWLKFARGREDQTAYEVGGVCYIGTASAQVLSVGDIVYMSATGLAKSTTAANYVGFMGVVVGGKLTKNEPRYGTGPAVTTGVAGESVLVQVSGIAWVVAGGTITVGTNFSVVPDTGTAGRVIAGTTQGQMIGTVITAGAAAGDMKILINQR